MRKVLLLLSLAFIVSCSSVDCPVKNWVRCYYTVYDSEGALLQLQDTLTIYTKRKNRTDTILLNSGIGLKAFDLPVSYTQPEDTLFFHFYKDDYDVTDTVWIKKDDYPHFESMECKVDYFHQLTGVRYTTHAIDSLVLKNPNVNYEDQTINFFIYPDSSR